MVDTLAASARLTEPGTIFMAGMGQTLRRWEAESVSARHRHAPDAPPKNTRNAGARSTAKSTPGHDDDGPDTGDVKHRPALDWRRVEVVVDTPSCLVRLDIRMVQPECAFVSVKRRSPQGIRLVSGAFSPKVQLQIDGSRQAEWMLVSQQGDEATCVSRPISTARAVSPSTARSLARFSAQVSV